MDLREVFRSLKTAAADVLWPPACILCRNYCRDTVCKECRARSLLFEGGSAFAGAQHADSSCAPACRRIYAAGVYAGDFKTAVTEYKFQGQLWIGKGLAEIMYQMILQCGLFEDCSFVTYVPVSDKRFAERGFDQSEFVAKLVAGQAGVDCKNVLLRNVQGGTQSKFNRKERLEKSCDRFVYNDAVLCTDKHLDKTKNIILIDDILTTGATLQECASLLGQNGFESVTGVVIATGRKDI